MLIDTMYRYSYYEDETYDDAFILQVYDWQRKVYALDDEFDLESLAERCAEDFLHNHDGWDYGSWTQGTQPITLYIWIDENTKIAYNVHLEYEPTFTATKRDEQTD
jgi:hypothetical protein